MTDRAAAARSGGAGVTRQASARIADI